MVLYGVSHEEALIVLLFIESAWWCTEIWGIFFPMAIGLNPFISFHFLESIATMTSTVVYFIKFITVTIFWSALLHNQGRCKFLLKTWYFLSIFGDLLYFANAVTIRLLSKDGTELEVLLESLPFLILRIFFWIFATLVVRSACQTGGDCFFPGGFWTFFWDSEQSFQKILLIWEIIWYSMIAINVNAASFYGYWQFLMPIFYQTRMVAEVVYTLVIISALVTLLAILKNWKQFLKLWLIFYFVINIGLFTGANGLEMIYVFETWSRQGVSFLKNCLNIGITAVFPLFAIFLRYTLIVKTVRFVYGPIEPQSELLKPRDLENQPLIGASSLKVGKPDPDSEN